MSIKKRLFAVGIAGLLVAGFSLPAQAMAGKAEGAIARLESRVDGLKREILLPPKKGAATLSKLRNRVRAINEEIAHLRSGGEVDAERIADLTGSERGVRLDPEEIARRAAARQEAMERKLLAGPKVGALHRQAIRQDLDRLDGVIASLESGREVDPDVLGDLLGMMIADAAKSPEDRLRDSQVQLATSKRRRVSGPKLGMATRAKLHEEIEELDALIERLETELNR